MHEVSTVLFFPPPFPFFPCVSEKNARDASLYFVLRENVTLRWKSLRLYEEDRLFYFINPILMEVLCKLVEYMIYFL